MGPHQLESDGMVLTENLFLDRFKFQFCNLGPLFKHWTSAYRRIDFLQKQTAEVLFPEGVENKP
jgi:hypothetical protein